MANYTWGHATRAELAAFAKLLEDQAALMKGLVGSMEVLKVENIYMSHVDAIVTIDTRLPNVSVAADRAIRAIIAGRPQTPESVAETRKPARKKVARKKG